MSRKNWTSEKIFNRLVNNKTKKTYWENIRELRKRPNKDVFNRAVELAKSTNKKEKVIGIDVLAQLGLNPRYNQKKTVKIYFNLLKKEQPIKVLTSLLYGIGHNNENLKSEVVNLICLLKNHKYSDVRFSLAVALGGVENGKAIETLIALSKDKNSYVRDWATFGIGSQIELNNKQIIDALWARINDTDRGTRFEAIFGLTIRRDRRIKEILKTELLKIDNFGSQILESIEELNDKDFIRLLKKQIKINETKNTVNEKWLKNTLKVLKSAK